MGKRCHDGADYYGEDQPPRMAAFENVGRVEYGVT
jgi:hypothetical protein